MAERKTKRSSRPNRRRSEHQTVAIYAADLKSLSEIVRVYPLDYGRRSHAITDPKGYL
jgi:hypothetical protein